MKFWLCFLVIALVAVAAVLSFVVGVTMGIKGSIESLEKRGWKVEPPEI